MPREAEGLVCFQLFTTRNGDASNIDGANTTGGAKGDANPNDASPSDASDTKHPPWGRPARSRRAVRCSARRRPR